MATINEGIMASMDAAASIETTYTMSVGDMFDGVLSQKFDEDWIEIELERGAIYEINLVGRGAAPDKAEDTILKLYDANGQHIVTNDDIDTANGVFDSRLVYTATASGTYYLSASSYSANPNKDNSGAYSLTVTLTKETPTTPTTPTDPATPTTPTTPDPGVGPDIEGTNRSETITGTEQGESISGLGGRDTINGLGGDDTLDGGSGEDTLNGGAGADVLIGGIGTNIASYEGSPAGVTVRLHNLQARGGDAQGDTFGGLIPWTYTDKGDEVLVQVPDIVHLTGSDEDDILAGDVRANTLRGGEGDDTLYGGPGGNETNDDRMYGDEGDDRLFGGRGEDELYGGDDNDLLRGGDHDDELYGEDGNDELYGGADNDELYGGAGDDDLYGEAGNDDLEGGSGDDTLDGGHGNDQLLGGDDDDTLVGGAGNDDIDGGDGDDMLEGGTGGDDLEGGPGVDTFKFNSGDGIDVIYDFTPGEDRIDLSSISSIDDMDDLDIVERGNSVEIDLPRRGELILENVFLSDLDDDDFIFHGDVPDPDPDTDPDPDPDPRPPVTGDPDPDRLHGTSRDDNLNSGGGNDVLYGARGNDTLAGGADVDSYEGGPGDDTIVVDYDDFTDGKAAPNTGDRTGMDLFDGGPGSDTLSFADFMDEDGDGDGVTVSATGAVTYNSGNVLNGLYRSIENFIGSPSDDNITGDGDDNVIEGGDGGDFLRGGGGNDTVSYRSSPSSVTINFGVTATDDRARKAHAAGDDLDDFDNIIGSAYDDILTGDANNNVIEGLAGADKLDGGGVPNPDSDIDTLSYASSNAGVTIDLNRGTGDFDDDENTILTASGGHAEDDKIKYGSFVHVIGSAHGDRITGDNQDNTLTGGAGNDTLKGDDGDDMLNGGPGGDTLDGGDDDVAGDTATYADATEGVTIDLSSVSVSNNVITIRNSSGRGDARGDRFIDIEEFVGSDHDDTFIAGPEDDNADGGDGMDTISYERSRKAVLLDLPAADGNNSTAQVGGDHANVTDNNGDVNKENYAQGDVLNNFENIIGSNVSSTSAHVDDNGDMIHDKLTGNDGANVIDGRGGDDKISGGGGNDTLIGGSGSDILTGGNGNDTFVISGRDTITDFTPAEDKLDFGGGSRSVLSLNYMVDDDGNLVITSGSNQVTLETITGIDNLTAANFIFNPDGYVRLTDNNPTSSGTRGNSTIHGGEGDNRLTGGSNMDIINGNGGDDTIDGGNGDDDINGGSGDDIIEGDAGADELDGGAGTDTLSYAGSPSGRTTGADANPRTGVTVSLALDPTDTENTGTHAEGDNAISNFENLTGSRYNDMLTGDGSVNVIKGGGGHDVISGGGGADELEGGAGRDRLEGTAGDFLSYAGSGSRVTVDLSDTDDVTLNATDTALFGVTADPATVSGVIKVSGGDASGDIATGFDHVIGGRSGDTLTGNDQANELRGMGGNDALTGGPGADMLKGGDGNDTLKGDGGDDMLDGGPGADKLDGGGTLQLSGTDIATYVSAEAGVTVDLSGGNSGRGDAAGDSFDGIEQYVGSYHADIFIVGDDEDHITGGPATGGPGGNGDTSKDTVSYVRSDGGVTVDLSANGAQSTTDNGYAGGDTLTDIENVIGSDHRDILTAADGGSVITGGEEDDTLVGGSGSDTFVFASGDGDDEINSFTITGGQDKIDLSAFTSIASLDDLRNDISNRGGDIEIDLLPGTSGAVEIRLNAAGGFDSSDDDFYGLTADNFIFYTKRISGNIGDRFNNEINGGSGDDAIYGEQGRDILNGGAGDDEIYGGENEDTINGGEGDDWLDGGPGDDTFVFEPGNGNDHIMDFTSGDMIDLSAFTDAGGNPLEISDIQDETTGDDNYVIDLSEFGGGTITVLDVTTLGGDFIFS